MTPKTSIEVALFDPNYFIFNLGISLLRYEEEYDGKFFIRKEFQIGLLLLSIRFNRYYPEEYYNQDED